MSSGVVAGLRQAIPYLRLYRNQVFVVKCGGEALEQREHIRALLEQISVLHQLGIRVVLVHGGGTQATSLAKKLGSESQFIDGRRVTDEGMLDSLVMAVNGQAQTAILAQCAALKLPAIGVSGVDASLVTATKRPAKDGVDYGWVGDIQSVDGTALRDLLNDHYLPVVSPLCADESGQVLNVNADSVAAAVAVALNAAKMILVTTSRGILARFPDEHSLVSHIDLKGLLAMEAEGQLRDGMLPKAASIAAALEGGVERVHVVSYLYQDSLLTEVFTNEGCGTLIVKDESILGPDEA